MAGIQTSNITTAAADDLTIQPAAGKKTILKSPDSSNPGQTPLGTLPTGEVERLDMAVLSVMADDLEDDDWIMVQDTSDAKKIKKISATEIGGSQPVDPSPGDVTAVPGFLGGDGTAANPYVITPATVLVPGGSATSEQTITIANQKEFVPVPFTDLSTGAANRFAQPGGTTDAAGIYSFNLRYLDSPSTALGSGQVYNGSIKVGTSSVYFKWDVTQIANQTQFGPASAPTASPTSVNYAADGKYGTVSATWADGARTLTATNMVFSVNGGALNGSNKAVANGNTVAIGFVDATVAAAANGAKITGTLQSTDGVYYSPFELVKDTVPAPFSIAPLTGQATNAVVTTGNNPLSGVNAPTTISAPVGGANALTSVQVSVNGAAFTSSYPVTFKPGDSLQARGTTGSTPSQTYTTTFTVGGTSSVMSVTTGAGADLVQPQITSPPNLNGVKQAPDVTITSTSAAYADGTAIVHQSSDWQAYKSLAGAAGAAPNTEPPNAANYTLHEQSMGDTTNKVSWNPTTEFEEGSTIFTRVKHRDASANESEYSPWSGFEVQEKSDIDTWGGAVATEANDWRGITFGDDRFVAVATSGDNRVMVSQDALTWYKGTATEPNAWTSITYGAGKFVAVSDDGNNRIMYSIDGFNWIPVSSPHQSAWYSVTYGGDKFVAVGGGGNINGDHLVMYSYDGISWNTTRASSGGDWISVTWGNNRFVALRDYGPAHLSVMYSSNAVAWERATATADNNWSSVTFGDNKFVAVRNDSSNNVMMYSNDGISWTSSTTAAAGSWSSVTYGNGRFVAVASTGDKRVMYSTNGRDWTSAAAPEDNNWSSVTYGNGKFVAVASTGDKRVMYSFA